MPDSDPPRPHDEPEEEAPNRRGALVALIVVAVLIVGGILLSQTLHSTGKLQDCVMSGRTNCAPVGQ